MCQHRGEEEEEEEELEFTRVYESQGGQHRWIDVESFESSTPPLRRENESFDRSN